MKFYSYKYEKKPTLLHICYYANKRYMKDYLRNLILVIALHQLHVADFPRNFNFKLISYSYFLNMTEEEDWDAELEGGGTTSTVTAKPVYDAWNNSECQNSHVAENQRSPQKSVNGFARSRGRGEWGSGRSDRNNWRDRDENGGQGGGFGRGNRGRGFGRDEGRRGGGRGGSFGGGWSSRNENNEEHGTENQSTMYVESSSVGRIIGKQKCRKCLLGQFL